jgi:hypothetical protein
MADNNSQTNKTKTHKGLKKLHVLSTLWFIVCVIYRLIAALRAAGFHWWIIFSLSGHSAVVVFILISLYLFSLFRGVSRTQQIDIEHPFTNTEYYMFLYVTAPFLGGVAGLIGSAISLPPLEVYIDSITLGTFALTFLVWVILDPLLAIMEMMLPGSRQHRHARLARQRARRQEKYRRREHLLNRIHQEKQENLEEWSHMLEKEAQELARLLHTDEAGFSQAEMRAVEIGAYAWRLGGIACMRHLHQMAMTLSDANGHESDLVDYITVWWDGIGTWRNTVSTI